MRSLAGSLVLSVCLSGGAAALLAQDPGFDDLERSGRGERPASATIRDRIWQAARGDSRALGSLVMEFGRWGATEHLLKFAMAKPITDRHPGAVSAAVRVLRESDDKELLAAASEALFYLYVLGKRETDREIVGEAARAGLIELGWVMRLDGDRITIVSAPVADFPRVILLARVRWTHSGNGDSRSFGDGIAAFADPEPSRVSGSPGTDSETPARPTFGRDSEDRGSRSDVDDRGRGGEGATGGASSGGSTASARTSSYSRAWKCDPAEIAKREKAAKLRGKGFWQRVGIWFRDDFWGPSIEEQIRENRRRAEQCR